MVAPTSSDSLAVPSPARLHLRRVAVPAKRALLRAWRSALEQRAVDDTTASETRSCLVLAPHPDDETLGCGATIARKAAAGTPVRVIVATDGRFSHRSTIIGPEQLAEIRAGECRGAVKALGLGEDDLVRLGIREGALDPHSESQVTRLAHEIDRFQPDEVLVTTCLDWHPDHRALHALLSRALERTRSRPLALCYPIWAWADGPWSHRPGRSAARAAADLVREPFVSIAGTRPLAVSADGFLRHKRAAMAEYRSQTTNLTGEPQWAVMDEAFLAAFLRPTEMFLPLPWGAR